MVQDIPASLTIERIQQARETLTAAFRMVIHNQFAGAIEALDPAATFSEAKRNLTALVAVLHGDAAWEALLDADR